MNYRQWPYNVRCFFAAPVPRWLTGTLVPAAIAALVVAVFCSGCTAAVRAYGLQAYEGAKAADDTLAQALKVGICSLPAPAYLRNYREDELRGISILCEDKLLMDYLEGLKHRAAEMKAACEPEVGP